MYSLIPIKYGTLEDADEWGRDWSAPGIDIQIETQYISCNKRSLQLTDEMRHYWYSIPLNTDYGDIVNDIPESIASSHLWIPELDRYSSIIQIPKPKAEFEFIDLIWTPQPKKFMQGLALAKAWREISQI